MNRHFALLLLPIISGCQSVRNFVEPLYDAAPVAAGAGIGTLFSPIGAVFGAIIGSIYNAAVEMAAIENAAKNEAIKTIVRDKTNPELWGEWWTILVPVLAVAFLVGWLLNKPSDMLKKRKKL